MPNQYGRTHWRGGYAGYVRQGMAYCNDCGKELMESELMSIEDKDGERKRLCRECYNELNGRNPTANSAIHQRLGS